MQPFSMNELIGTLMAYEAEHQNKESNSKGKKGIIFKANFDDTVNKHHQKIKMMKTWHC